MLLAVLSLIVSMLATAGVAQAASAYDGLLHTSPTLFVYTDGSAKSQTMDVSQSWYNSLGQAYDARLAQNIGWATNFMTELDAIRSSGGSWGVFMVENAYGNYLDVIGTRDPNATCGFVGDASTGTFQCSSHPGYGFVRAEQFAYNTYADHGCSPTGVNVCSNDGMFLNTEPVTVTSTAGYVMWGAPVSQLSNYTFYAMHFNTTYPDGYAGTIIPTSPPPATYVAMGDSFSSGEANAPYEAGTDQDSDSCHRSTSAWPRRVQAALDLGTTAFVACSGAVSDYIINEYNQENVELPQADFVSSATKLVTITIGGNDVGFGNVLTTCTLPTSESGTTEEKHQIEHDACVQAIDNARAIASSSTFQTKLEAVFSGVRSLGNQNLQVVVAGYPNLFPAFDDITETCVWGNGYLGTSGRTVASDEVQKARLLHDELNATIAAAVIATGDSHIHFVDPSSAFAGHELCRSTPWFYNVIPDAFNTINRRGSYHPNASGQTAYATVIEGEVNSIS